MQLSLYTLLTSELSIEDSIAMAAKCGFDAVDIRMHQGGVHITEDVSDAEVARIRGLVEDAGLKVSGLTTYNIVGLVCRDEWKASFAKMKRAAEVAKLFGAGFMRCSGPRTEPDYEAVRCAFREQAPQVAALGRETGVVITAEQHGGLLFASAGQIMDMLRGLDDDFLGIVFDPGNCLREGFERPTVQVAMLARFIKAVHVKTFSGVATSVPSADEYVPNETRRLDQGILDWPKIVGALKAAGYDGYLTLEDFHNFPSLEEKFTWDVEFLRGPI